MASRASARFHVLVLARCSSPAGLGLVSASRGHARHTRGGCPARVGATTEEQGAGLQALSADDAERTAVQKFLQPDPSELDNELEMTVWEHLEELRERVLIAAVVTIAAILGCFCFAKELVVFLEAPVAEQGRYNRSSSAKRAP